MQQLSYNQIIEKVQNFCAYQERSNQEVRQKLKDLGAEVEDFSKILAYLQEYNFLNEARFTAQFTKGKFRIKRWGRIRIRQELRMKGVNSDMIAQVLLDELGDDEVYEQTLLDLLAAKSRTIRETDTFKRNQKLAQAALSRGFESNLVWAAIKKFNPKKHKNDNNADIEDYEDDF
jgi:regulatory protein